MLRSVRGKSKKTLHFRSILPHPVKRVKKESRDSKKSLLFFFIALIVRVVKGSYIFYTFLYVG
nr:MAG TPA: hypothetical protein [Caudoviricetes sp.]